MAMIKSALELALEKTKTLSIDEKAIEAKELKQEGKRAAGQYLEDPASGSLGKKLAGYPQDKLSPLREGMFEILVSQLQLPAGSASLEKLETLAKGFASLASGGAEKKILALFQQLGEFFKQYVDDMKNVEEAIKKQWAPRLREKERQLAARMGQDVRIDPMSDPDFAAFYKQNVSAVRQQYEAALAKVKTDLAALLGIPR